MTSVEFRRRGDSATMTCPRSRGLRRKCGSQERLRIHPGQRLPSANIFVAVHLLVITAVASRRCLVYSLRLLPWHALAWSGYTRLQTFTAHPSRSPATALRRLCHSPATLFHVAVPR